jgi:hypothetical protein
MRCVIPTLLRNKIQFFEASNALGQCRQGATARLSGTTMTQYLPSLPRLLNLAESLDLHKSQPPPSIFIQMKPSRSIIVANREEVYHVTLIFRAPR